MGAQQSLLVANQLQLETIGEMLENDEFVNSIGQDIPNLSKKSIANLQNLAFSLQHANPSSRLTVGRFKPLLAIESSEIALPHSLVSYFVEWKADWTILFGTDLGWSISSRSISQGSFESLSMLSKTYKYILHLEKRRALDRIRWRFYTMFLYDLHKLVNNQAKLTARAYHTLVDAVDSSLEHRTEIENNLRSWISRGHRYRNLSDALGGSGCLFILPQSISDYLWEVSLPLGGKTFEEAVQRLIGLGIREKAEELGATNLGFNIERGLLDSFYWDVRASH